MHAEDGGEEGEREAEMDWWVGQLRGKTRPALCAIRIPGDASERD